MRKMLLLLVLCLLLAGCKDAKPAETVLPTVPETEVTETTEGIKEADPYAPVLEIYRQALTEQWHQGQCMEAGISLLTAYCMEGASPLQNLCYALYDLDGDGDEELLIAPTFNDGFVDNMAFDGYDLVDGQPRQLFCGSERNRYYLCYGEDGTCWVANEGSGGAGHSGWFYYLYDGKGLAIQHSVVFDSDSLVDSPWFVGADDSWDISSMTNVPEAEARNVIDSYEKMKCNIHRGFNCHTFDMQ
jgi:hypothetical protein